MAALVVVHMAEVQGSTGVSNEKGTGGEYGQGLVQRVGRSARRGWWVTIKVWQERRGG